MVKRFFMKSPVQQVTKRELHTLINERTWKEKGVLIRQMREAFGISVNEMAEYLSISPARVKRFESSEPVNDTK